jgi:hypothetical protein
LLAAQRSQPDKFIEELTLDVPPEGRFLFDVFVTLGHRRRAGFDTAQAFVLADIEAYCRLHRLPLTSWELDTLLEMDSAALVAAHRIRAADKDRR